MTPCQPCAGSAHYDCEGDPCGCSHTCHCGEYYTACICDAMYDARFED